MGQRSSHRSLTLFNSNPRLGAFVRRFHHEPDVGNLLSHGEFYTAESIEVRAAENMISLQCATLRASPFTERIVWSMNNYRQLSELSLYMVDPLAVVWPPEMTALTKLTWSLPSPVHGENHSWSLKRAALVLKVAQVTCPLLQSLDLVFGQLAADNPPSVWDRSKPYTRDDRDLVMRPIMQHLQHFRITGSIPESFDGEI